MQELFQRKKRSMAYGVTIVKGVREQLTAKILIITRPLPAIPFLHTPLSNAKTITEYCLSMPIGAHMKPAC